MLDGMFVVTAVDGDFVDVLDPSTSSLRFDSLCWKDALTLIGLCLAQDFEIVLWRQEGGENEQEENPVPEAAL